MFLKKTLTIFSNGQMRFGFFKKFKLSKSKKKFLSRDSIYLSKIKKQNKTHQLFSNSLQSYKKKYIK